MIHGSFGTNCASVTVNNALNGCEPYSRTFECVGVMQTLKYTEELMDVFHIKPSTIVSYKYDDFMRAAMGIADLDHGLFPLTRKLDRVRNEIHKYKLQHRAVSVATGKRADLP